MKKSVFMLAILSSIIFIHSPVIAATPITNSSPSVPSLPPLDENTALKQIVAADQLVSHLQSVEAKSKEFAYNYRGRAYDYMAPEFSTKEKITNYLAQIYTKDAAAAYYDLAGYEVFNQRVIHFTGGISHEYTWDKAIISLVDDLPTSKTFNLILPLMGNEYFERNIVFKYVPNTGWRIATLPNDTWIHGDVSMDTMSNDGWKTHP